MADNASGGPTRDEYPGWVRKILKWLAIATAIIGAVTVLLLAVGKFGDAAFAPCKTISSLPWCSAGQPLSLPPFDAGPTDGGHGQAEFCDPRATAYRAQYPDYAITWQGSQTSHKDLLGHVTYRFHCEFAAVPNVRGLRLWMSIGGISIGLLIMLGLWQWRQRRRRES